MAETIRRIEENDFQAVAAMYNGRKSVEELKWLYTNPENPKIYNAFVAINEQNKIIGEIAYTLSKYVQDDEEFQGIIPMNWKIELGYKGMAGVLLFKKVLSLGDFGITISGSETAQNLYSLFKFHHKSNIDEFYKILNVINLLISFKRKGLIKTLGMIGFLTPSILMNPSHKKLDHDVELIQYNGENFVGEKKIKNVFKKEISKNYIDWLLQCPTLKSYAFCIKMDSQYYGICVLYIKNINGINRGRIVHLPYLGNNETLWESVIEKCITFFKKEKCCIVTALAHNSINQLGYIKSGFIRIKKHRKPLFIKDTNQKLSSFHVDNWFLQFSEGDKAYRDL